MLLEVPWSMSMYIFCVTFSWILYDKIFCECHVQWQSIWFSLGRIWYLLSSLEGSVFLCYGLSPGIEWCTDNVDIVWCVTVVMRYHLYFFDCSVCHFPSQCRVQTSCCWSQTDPCQVAVTFCKQVGIWMGSKGWLLLLMCWKKFQM